MANDARTNNVCEGWNNAFRALVGHLHPSLTKCIDGFKGDVTKTRMRIQHLATGVVQGPQTKIKYKRLQRHLRALCVRYVTQQVDLPFFVRAIGHSIHNYI